MTSTATNGVVERICSFCCLRVFYFLGCLLLLSFHGSAQKVTIQGIVQDTTEQKPLHHAVAMAIRLSDSLLTGFSRTDSNGFFKLDSVPVDTYQVVISHPRFGDQSVIVLGSKDNNFFDLKKIVLPPKSVTLKEVTIFGFADAVYYRGDTLVYTADSFKVKKDAVVEDLLRRLPGIKVDAQGKIFSQGKQVDQVLVDGDEFFGADQTVATRNLAAKSVESVEVYDKKNENASENTDKETLKVMNLKLKEDAKKGYFGKLTGATDFDKYYESEALANHFKDKQKISVFGIASNTLRSSLNWNDMYSYGLSNEYNSSYNDEGGMMMTWDNNNQQGIPTTKKTGFYYTDMIGKKTKLSLNYTYSNNTRRMQTLTSSQYFLPDTSYKTNNVEGSDQQNISHAANMTLIQTIDSLTELEIMSKIKNSKNTQSSLTENNFLTSADEKFRSTAVNNSDNSTTDNWINSAKLTRNFKKRDRKLVANYSYTTNDINSDGILKSTNKFFGSSAIPDSSTDQKKTITSNNQTHAGAIAYTEPFSKRIKAEVSYDFIYSTGLQDKITKDFMNGDYNSENPALTNSFKSYRTINRAGAKLTYEVKKQTLSIGARVRQVNATNTNTETGEVISQLVNNILPYLRYHYKIADNSSVGFNYSTNSDQPSMNQLQPVPDFTNPNFIVKGNPDLLPTFKHTFDVNYISYKPITGRNAWMQLGFTKTDNAFSNATTYDSIGRTISQPINVQGNYNAYGYLNADYPILSRLLEISPSANFNYNQSTNYINGLKNTTKESTPNATLELQLHTDSMEFSVGGNYTYHYSSSSLSTASNKPYYTYGYTGSFSIELPLKMKAETNANYYQNKQRTALYNVNYLIWNISLSKRFLKSENLIASIDMTDLLNQNTSTYRDVRDNVISDVRSTVIGRYILLKAVFKFNSNKKKDEEGDE